MPEEIKLNEALPGQAVELGKVEYCKTTVDYEGKAVEVLQKSTVDITKKMFMRNYLDTTRVNLLAQLAEIDALIAEAEKLGL